jgi:hypothetical protein
MASYDAGKKKNSSTNFDLDFMKETKYGSDPLSLTKLNHIGRNIESIFDMKQQTGNTSENYETDLHIS